MSWIVRWANSTEVAVDFPEAFDDFNRPIGPAHFICSRETARNLGTSLLQFGNAADDWPGDQELESYEQVYARLKKEGHLE
jgi:hypothetical protein